MRVTVLVNDSFSPLRVVGQVNRLHVSGFNRSSAVGDLQRHTLSRGSEGKILSLDPS